MKHKNMPAIKFTSPLFLVGMPRSGTKLLRGLLNQHPSIEIPNVETHFLPYWKKHWKEYGDLSDQNNFSYFYNQVTNIPYFAYMREEEGIIEKNDWYQGCKNFKISGVFEALIRHDSHTPIGSEKIWGDKTPSYINQIPLIKELFPSAKIIHIIRDVRDYSLSTKVTWGKNMMRSTDRWVDGINTFRNNLKYYPDDILELRYEDLLDNPEKQLSQICDFMNLKFDAHMLQLATPCEKSGNTKNETSIVKNNKQKFLSEMTFKERESLERIAKPILEQYGYPFEYKGKTKRVNNVKMLLYKVMDGLNLFRYESKKRGLLEGIQFQWNLYLTARN
jgi:hypothetical protein